LALTLRSLPAAPSEQLAAAIEAFDCVGTRHAEDEVAHEVNAFLREGGFAPQVEHDLSSTYILADTGAAAEIVGYFTLAPAVIRLTGSELRGVGSPGISEIGAIRLVMLGVDHRRAGAGHGSTLVQSAVGAARQVREFVAVRFLVADVNPTQEEWYVKRHFQLNGSERERERGGTTISMRLDLRLD
jgi:GNAT superfamily N-acetyltransferase